MSGGFIVDFVGLPASGKTWLSRRVAGHLRDTLRPGGLPITTSSEVRRRESFLPDVAWRVMRMVGRDPGRSLRCADGLRRSRQLSRLKAVRMFAYQQYLQAEFRAARRDGRIHLADQGLLQFLWRVHLTAEADGADYLRRLLEAWDGVLLPDVVVLVRVDHRTRMDRANERGTPVDAELYDPDHPLIQDDRRSFEEITRFIRSELVPSMDERTVVRVQNREDNVGENLASIAAAIEDASTDSPVNARGRAAEGPVGSKRI